MIPIRFRPHHFLCAYCYKGNGYSSTFTQNFTNLMQELSTENGDDTVIEIVHETDSICAPCPHRQNTLCSTQEKIERLDEAHANALQITSQENITWGEAKKRIQTQITLDTFHRICKECEWKKFGICESVLSC